MRGYTLMELARGLRDGMTSAAPSRIRIYKPNGKREVARRLRQIAAGQLKVSE